MTDQQIKILGRLSALTTALLMTGAITLLVAMVL